MATVFPIQKFQDCLLERHIDILMTTHLLSILTKKQEKDFRHKNSVLSGIILPIEDYISWLPLCL